MKTINDYIDLAIEKHSIKSDRKLSIALGMNPISVQSWRTGRSIPSDNAMIKLANMAEIPTEQALLELAYWRADGEAKKTYGMLLKKLVSTAACIALITGYTTSSAYSDTSPELSESSTEIVYYGN